MQAARLSRDEVAFRPAHAYIHTRMVGRQGLCYVGYLEREAACYRRQQVGLPRICLHHAGSPGSSKQQGG